MAHYLGELTESNMKNLQALIDSNSVIGKEIVTPDGTVILPVSKVSFGFGSGGGDLPSSQKELFVGVFQEEVAKGDTSVFPEGGRLPHRAGRPGKYRVGRGTHGRENAPPAFGLCPADRGQPPVCKGDYRE